MIAVQTMTGVMDERALEIDELRERIEYEERKVGLRPDGHVTPVEISRRRLQIVGVMLLVFVGLAVTTIANDVWNDLRRQRALFDPELVRILMIVFAAGFAVYVLEKEQHLKRLAVLGQRAEELDLVVAERVLMSAVVAEMTEAVSASLDLEEVLAQVLRESERLVGASVASISLLAEGGHLREAWTRGAGVASGKPLVAESILVQVALAREPLLLSGPLPFELTGHRPTPRDVASVACVPLVREERTLGVLTVAAPPGRRYSNSDVDVLARLAVSAATAIGNARRFEAARMQEFEGIDARREELREIGRSIRDAVTLARRTDLEPCEQADLLDRVDGHAAHLQDLVG